jgi:hypothetical protein
LNLYRPRIVRSKHVEECNCRQAADSKLLCTIEKLTAINAAMHVSVKQVQEFLREIGRFLSFHRITPNC